MRSSNAIATLTMRRRWDSYRQASPYLFALMACAAFGLQHNLYPSGVVPIKNPTGFLESAAPEESRPPADIPASFELQHFEIDTLPTESTAGEQSIAVSEAAGESTIPAAIPFSHGAATPPLGQGYQGGPLAGVTSQHVHTLPKPLAIPHYARSSKVQARPVPHAHVTLPKTFWSSRQTLANVDKPMFGAASISGSIFKRHTPPLGILGGPAVTPIAARIGGRPKVL